VKDPPRKRKRAAKVLVSFGSVDAKKEEKKDKKNNQKKKDEEFIESTPSATPGMSTTTSVNRTLSNEDLAELTKTKRKETNIIDSWGEIIRKSVKNAFQPEKEKKEKDQEESKEDAAAVDRGQPQPKEKVTEILISGPQNEETKVNFSTSDENLQSFIPLSDQPSRTLKRTLSKTQDHIIRITYSNFGEFTIPVMVSEQPLHPSIPSISTVKDETPSIVEIADNKFLVKTTPCVETAERDPHNGVMTFKANAEFDLLLHVQNKMNNLLDAGNALTLADRVGTILRSVDEYCTGKQWMFHVGQDKGGVLTDFLKECIDVYNERNEGSVASKKPFRAVELGTYCGYSAILLAQEIKNYAPDLDFHLYSTEVSPKYAQIANTMIQMAKLDDYISVILFDPSIKSLTKALTSHINDDEGTPPMIDYLFMDHAKDMYLSDLQELEDCDLVRAGSHVAADNVVFSKLEKYRKYVAGLAKRSLATTKMVDMNLEYSDVQDGIELTVYLQDDQGKVKFR